MDASLFVGLMATAGNAIMKPLVRTPMTRRESKLKCFVVKFKTRFIAKDIGRKLRKCMRTRTAVFRQHGHISKNVISIFIEFGTRKSVFQYHVLSIFFHCTISSIFRKTLRTNIGRSVVRARQSWRPELSG